MSQSSNRVEALIKVTDLHKHFPIQGGMLKKVKNWVQAVDGVSFEINAGETLGLVGESGCGKSTVGLTMLRLLEATQGTVFFEGTNVFDLKGRELKTMRRNMQIIFQDPYSSLDPRMPIGESIAEGIRVHKIGDPKLRQQLTFDVLKKVGLKEYHAKRFPHEFSGGQRQRIGIARALAVQPKFIVADEPVSALDVSIQAEVLNLLKDLQAEFDLTFLFIAHNLGVIEHISDRVAVMYLGKIVEMAPTEMLFRNPLHPYTEALMSAIPTPNPRLRKERIILSGDVPSPVDPPAGCRFHPRCPIATKECSTTVPELIEIEPEHWVESCPCWHKA